MTALKIASIGIGSLIVVLILTVVFVYARIKIQLPGVSATGISLIREWTVRSPIYWLFAIAVVGGAFWLFRRWITN